MLLNASNFENPLFPISFIYIVAEFPLAVELLIQSAIELIFNSSFFAVLRIRRKLSC